MQDQSQIPIAVLSRYQLDCEGLVSLLDHDPRFKVVAVLTDLRTVTSRLRPHRPLVAIVDAKMGHHRAFGTGKHLLSKSATKFVLFVDSEPNRRRAERALSIENTGYVTRTQTFAEIGQGIVDLVNGGRPTDPVAARWLPKSPSNNTRQKRCRRIDPPATLTLTTRERDVLRLLADGNTVDECADILGIKPSTADNHKSRLMKKLGAHRTVELVRLAIREKVIKA